MAIFCPCVSIAQVVARLGISVYVRTLVLLGVVHITCTVCSLVGTPEGRAVAIVLGLMMWFYLIKLRMQIREIFHIPGSCIGDSCSTLWCSFCSIAQMASQVDAYDTGNCNFSAKDILPGYPVV